MPDSIDTYPLAAERSATHYFRRTLTPTEQLRYSLAPLITQRHPDKRASCLASEISLQLSRSYGLSDTSGPTPTMIPLEILMSNLPAAREISELQNSVRNIGGGLWEATWLERSMQATTPSSGGYLVENELMPLEPIWQAVNAASRLGARFSIAREPTGHPVRPLVTGDVSLEWLAEMEQGEESGATLAARAAPFQRIAGGVIVSKQLLIQAPEMGTRALAARLLAAAGVEIDRGILVGTGGSQPAGIIPVSHSGEVTFGGAADNSKLVDIEGTLIDANVPANGLGWVISSTTLRKWRNKSRETGSGRFLVERVNNRFEALGYPLEATTLLATGHKAVLGRFGNVSVIDQRGPFLPVIIDPFTRASTFETVVWIDMLVSVDIKPQAFCVSTDSAAQ